MEPADAMVDRMTQRLKEFGQTIVYFTALAEQDCPDVGFGTPGTVRWWRGFPSFASDARAAVYLLEHYRKNKVSFSVVDRGGFGVQATIGTNSPVGGKWGDALTQKFEVSICWASLRYEGVLPP